MMSKIRKSGHFFEKFQLILSWDRGVCPGTFTPALVLGQRDAGARIFFCPGTKGQWDVPPLGNPTLRFVGSRVENSCYISTTVGVIKFPKLQLKIIAKIELPGSTLS